MWPPPFWPTAGSPVVHDHVVATACEVVDQVSANRLVGKRIVNDDHSGDECVCAQHCVKLPQLIAEVPNLLATTGDRLAEHLQACLRALVDHAVLREPWHDRIGAGRHDLHIVLAQTSMVAWPIGTAACNSSACEAVPWAVDQGELAGHSVHNFVKRPRRRHEP